MNAGERFVVLGLATTRSEWFTAVSRWATSAALPIEFVKCLSVEELRARLGGGRRFSAVVVDGAAAGLDRDLVDTARSSGCAVLVVDAGKAGRDWIGLGAAAVLPRTLSRADLHAALGAHTTPIARSDVGAAAAGPPSPEPSGWLAPLVAVTGIPGGGVSTVAAALAQALGDDPRWAGDVVLADLALDAQQAVLHDAGDVVPGLPELVEAHRLGQPSADEVRRLTGRVHGRGYDLLLGLRRHRDWTALRPRATEAALRGLRRAYRTVVADVGGDLEGEDQCGSPDVEDRNRLARTTVAAADVVLVVGQPGITRLHALVRLLDAVLAHGVDAERLVTVLNRSPRPPRARAELTRALAALTAPVAGSAGLGSPLHLPERRGLDDLVHDGTRLPGSLGTPLAAVATARLATLGSGGAGGPIEPVAVIPGSLGSWTEPADADGAIGGYSV